MPVCFDRFELDVTRRRLTRCGRSVRLQPQPLSLLIALVGRAGQTVTREELRQTLWPEGTHVDYDPALNTAMRKLRRALGDDTEDPRYVCTVPGVGYRFIARLERPTPRATPTAPSPSPSPSRVVRRLSAARVAALLVVGVLSIGTSAPHGRTSPAWESIREGIAQMAMTPPRVDEARRTFEDATMRDPYSGSAWAWLAYSTARLVFASRDTGDADDGFVRAAAHRALALDERLWTAHAALAYVTAADDEARQESRALFERAIRLGGTDPRLFIDYACVLKDGREFVRALAVIERGLQHFPESAALRAHQGLHLHAVGRYDEELPALHAAVRLDPRAAEAHFHLGLGYARRQQYDSALASLRTAVTLSDGAPQFVSWFGRIAGDAGRLHEAEPTLRRFQHRATTMLVPALPVARQASISVDSD